MSKYFKAALVSFVLILAVIAAASRTGSTLAAQQEHWISVNISELAALTSSTRLDAADFFPHVEKVVSGIAILRLDEAQLEELSRAMHDGFHKCSGFVEHSSQADALAWIQRMNTVDPDAPTVDYSIDNASTVSTLFAAVSEPQNRQVILDLSAFPNRRYNQPSGLDSANWIKNKWTALTAGRSDATVEVFQHAAATSPQPSIILTIRGRTFPNEIIVLGAHQDSINISGQTQPAPGADDDGSGIACLTETIRVLMAKNFRPERTLKFMAYAAEEVGLRGSYDIAASFRNANANVIGVMQLDMTNYKGVLGNDIVIFTDYTSSAQNQFIRNLITTYQPNLVIGTSSCGYACSDHASWYNRSYPASFPFESTFNDDNPTIHTASDTIAQSQNNADHALKFSKLALSYVAELAKGCLSRQIRCQSTPIEVRPLQMKSSDSLVK